MEVKVSKFGGSSLSDSGQFKKVRDIIKAQDSRRYIVVSAPGKRSEEDVKVTDLLNEAYLLAKIDKSIHEVFEKVKDRYKKIIEELGIDLSLEEEFQKIKTSILHHADLDYVSSRGEYLNAIILAEYLGYSFLDAEKYIFFKENGRLDEEKTNINLAEALKDHEKAVIPGFYGAKADGTIKTFTRGGSDVTGAIVAGAVGADLYENWTDVSGMLMADPRIIKDPKVIKRITYKELRELSYMGATIMHEDAIFPVKKAGIKVNIRNTNFPSDHGTMIYPQAPYKDNRDVITGLAGKKGFSIIHIEKDLMNREVGFGRKVLEILEKDNIAFEHIPTGIDTMSVVVNSQCLVDIEDKVKKTIEDITKADKVSIQDGIAMIAVVGRDMIKEKSTPMRVFKALNQASINVNMIDQGSSQINIIIGVDEKDYISAIETIYAEFVE